MRMVVPVVAVIVIVTAVVMFLGGVAVVVPVRYVLAVVIAVVVPVWDVVAVVVSIWNIVAVVVVRRFVSMHIVAITPMLMVVVTKLCHRYVWAIACNKRIGISFKLRRKVHCEDGHVRHACVNGGRKVNGGVGEHDSNACARFVCIRKRVHRLDIYARLTHQSLGLLLLVVQTDAFRLIRSKDHHPHVGIGVAAVDGLSLPLVGRRCRFKCATPFEGVIDDTATLWFLQLTATPAAVCAIASRCTRLDDHGVA